MKTEEIIKEINTIMAEYEGTLFRPIPYLGWVWRDIDPDELNDNKIRFSRPDGGVFQLKHLSSLMETGTSLFNHEYVEPEVFSAKTDIEIRMSTLTSGVTAASVSAGFDIVLIDD